MASLPSHIAEGTEHVYHTGLAPPERAMEATSVMRRRKRPVPIFPSTFAEDEPGYQSHPLSTPHHFHGGPIQTTLFQRDETELPASKRQKFSPYRKSSGGVPDKSEWVTPEPLTKKGCHPPIFANHRQEMCETLQYFRSYHGGLYKRQGTAYGCLLDGYSALGDIFSDHGKVIITHTGGGSVPVSGSQRYVQVSPDGGFKGRSMRLGQSENRDSDANRSVFHCLEHSIPVVLIAGKNYTFMPFLKAKYGVAYAVLGFYLVTHGWAERDCKTQDLIRFKFRFQWLSSQGEPWWIDDIRGSDVEPSSFNPIVDVPALPSQRYKLPKTDALSKYVCLYCNTESARIYCIKKFCLNEECSRFFQKLNQNHQPLFETEWKYSHWVLNSQSSLETENRVPYQLIPFQVLQDLMKGQKIQPNLMGIYCSDCGRISCRIFWDLFKCETCATTHEFTKKQRKSVFCLSGRTQATRIENWISKSLKIDRRYISSVQGWNAIAYYLPNGSGTVIHAQRQPGHLEIADKLLRKYRYKTGGEMFRRNKLKMSRDPGMLGQQFTLNCGTPYRFSTG